MVNIEDKVTIIDYNDEIVEIKRDVSVESMIHKTTGFALAKFEKEMSLLQQRMFGAALSQIRSGDSVNSAYPINVKQLAKELKIARSSFKENMNNAVDTFLDKNQVAYFETENGWVRAVLMDNIEYVGDDTYLIQFGRKIMPYLIAMKEKYDMVYPLLRLATFKSKYTPFFYDYVLAEMNEDKFIIIITPDQVREIAQLKNGEYPLAPNLKDKILKPVLSDFNKFTEIIAEKLIVNKERIGRSNVIQNFELHVAFSHLLPIPLYKGQADQIDLFDNSTIPSEQTIINNLEEMHVAKSFIKSVLSKRQPIRAWRNILYTKLYGKGQARYFNKAYGEDWGRAYPIKDMQDRIDAINQESSTDDGKWKEEIQRFRDKYKDLTEIKNSTGE